MANILFLTPLLSSLIVAHCWLHYEFVFIALIILISFGFKTLDIYKKISKDISITLSPITNSLLLITNAYRVSNSYPFLMSRTHKSMLR